MVTKPQAVRAGATFVVAFGLTVGVLLGGAAAASEIIAISGKGCVQTNGTYTNSVTCTIPAGSAMIATPGIDISYFDYTNEVVSDTYLRLYKQSYSGTIEGDYRTIVNDPVGKHDEKLVADQINRNRNQWDYYYGELVHKNVQNWKTFWGVSVVTK